MSSPGVTTMERSRSPTGLLRRKPLEPPAGGAFFGTTTLVSGGGGIVGHALIARILREGGHVIAVRTRASGEALSCAEACNNKHAAASVSLAMRLASRGLPDARRRGRSRCARCARPRS